MIEIGLFLRVLSSERCRMLTYLTKSWETSSNFKNIGEPSYMLDQKIIAYLESRYSGSKIHCRGPKPKKFHEMQINISTAS